MSTDRIAGEVVFTCDRCDEELETGETEFYDAVAAKKREGWRSVKENGEWLDLCSCC